MAYMFWHSFLAFYLTFYSGILFWHSIWHLFWHSILPLYRAFILAFYLMFYSGILQYLAFLLTFSLTWALPDLNRKRQISVAVEVRQCPLTSGARSWGLAVPAAIWSSWLRRGSVPTAIWTSLLGEGRRQGRKEGRRKVTLIKSRDPHLAGGE